MKVLSIGSDRNIFKEGSAVRARMLEYGRLFEELHIIVFVNRFKINDLGFKVKKVQISKNIWVYPTHSLSRWFYVFDAIRIGKSIIEKARNDFVVSGQDPFECGLAASRIAHLFTVPLHIQIHTDFLSPHFRSASLLNRL